MEIKLTLALPNDQLSVPVVRRVLVSAMKVLGVDGEVIDDIQLALTEAVTNVLEHAADGDEYEVSAGIDGNRCILEVIDRGGGFDSSLQGLSDAESDAEGGRGIQIMRALVDRVSFDHRPVVGTVVHLEKDLHWDTDSVLQRLTAERPPTEHGPWTTFETMDDIPVPDAPAPPP